MDPHRLDAINRVVHDHWFNVADVAHDAAHQTLAVKFTRPSETVAETTRRILFLRRVRVQITEWWLEIHNVESYTLQETEGIGRYDFNELQFSEADRTLTIKTGVPLRFWVRVTALDVLVRETSLVVDEKVRTTF